MRWYTDKPVPAKRRPLVPVVLDDGTESFRSDGWFEDRDPRGVEVHWTWLHGHWNACADKLEELEAKGILT